MIAVLILGVGVIVLLATWRFGLGAARSPVSVAVLATLATLGSVFNIVVPVSNVEATTTLVACVALVLGFRSGLLVGVLAVIGTGIASGFGVWTGWQVAGFAVVAAGMVLVGSLSRAVPSAWRWPSLGAAIALLTLAYDVVLSLPSAGMLPGAAGMASLPALLLLGAPFTLTHVVGNVIIFLAIGPSLVHALERARVRIANERFKSGLSEPAG